MAFSWFMKNIDLMVNRNASLRAKEHVMGMHGGCKTKTSSFLPVVKMAGHNQINSQSYMNLKLTFKHVCNWNVCGEICISNLYSGICNCNVYGEIYWVFFQFISALTK